MIHLYVLRILKIKILISLLVGINFNKRKINPPMDDLTQRYYEAEMRYLREAGKEFAQAYPTVLRCLILINPAHAIRGAPVRGLRFLMGRLREKLDDDLPELTEGWSACCGRTTCEPSRRFPWSN